MIKPVLTVAAGAAALLGSAAIAKLVPPPPTPGVPAYASLKGDPIKGKAVFTACKTCHVVTPNVNRIGPSLHGIVGRPSGTVPKYTYSAANKAAAIVWTEPVLYQYLEAPRKYMPGTKMTYAGLKQPQQRADVIAYLKTKPTS